MSADVCNTLLRSIKSSKFIIVDEPKAREVTRFYTISGERLIAACPEATEIEHSLLEWINYISRDSYIPLHNRAIGISLNATPSGGGFNTHPDRNAITIVLYLNDAEGGVLHVYRTFLTLFGRELLKSLPTVRLRLRILRRYAIKWLNLSHGRVAKRCISCFSVRFASTQELVPWPLSQRCLIIA